MHKADQEAEYRKLMGEEALERQLDLDDKVKRGICTCPTGKINTNPFEHAIGCAFRLKRSRRR